ncbi:MAG: hypothetical protein IAG13_30610 [Deltaproteobacteria bacterium]|nr:hypothetical protein [Nannocystaceae bacterium]
MTNDDLSDGLVGTGAALAKQAFHAAIEMPEFFAPPHTSCASDEALVRQAEGLHA